MENILVIPWCDATKPGRLAKLSAHQTVEDAASFIEEHSTPNLRPQIYSKEKGKVTAYDIPTHGADLELVRTVAEEGSTFFVANPKRPSQSFKDYHTLRGPFASSTGINMVIVDLKRPSAPLGTPADHLRKN